MESQNRWIEHYKPLKDVKNKLICLPYASGGSSKYLARNPHLNKSGIETILIQYPDRESCITKYNILVDSIEEAVYPIINNHAFSIFGYRTGGIPGYEVEKNWWINTSCSWIYALYL